METCQSNEQSLGDSVAFVAFAVASPVTSISSAFYCTSVFYFLFATRSLRIVPCFSGFLGSLLRCLGFLVPAASIYVYIVSDDSRPVNHANDKWFIKNKNCYLRGILTWDSWTSIRVFCITLVPIFVLGRSNIFIFYSPTSFYIFARKVWYWWV